MRRASSTFLVAAVVIAGLMNGSLWAQGTRLYGGGGWFWGQYGGLMGLEPLAEALKAQGISYQVPRAFIGIGGALAIYQGRFHTGLELGSFPPNDTVSGIGVWMRIGYPFLLRRDFMVMPVAMIGAGRLTFNIREDASLVPFNQIFTTPTPFSTIAARGRLAGGAVEVQKNFGSFLLGVSAGYMAGPGWKNWRSNDGRLISGGPRISPGMPYVRLQFGWLIWSSVQKKQAPITPIIYAFALPNPLMDHPLINFPGRPENLRKS